MKKLNSSILLIIVAALVIIAFSGMYIVSETEQVVITQFGKPVGKPITTPGVKFKIPFIQTAHFFDKRYLEWDGDPNQIPTEDKKFIFVDTYARWQIINPLQFFKRVRDERGAQSRLDDILDGETRNAVADNMLVELVRSSNRTPLQSSDTLDADEAETLDSIKVGRARIQANILKKANAIAGDLGIQILDFRIKRINYVKEVRQKVYDRMISERNRIADKFKSEGQGEASRINGERDKELKSIQSGAYKTAEEIRGKADARAALIYAKAYNQSAGARELYGFMKTMDSYKKTFDNKTSIILSTKSEFYRYLQNIEK
ncbi:MAG TPA: protease modulator HflC [Balneolales bacterium]|nr:protease modulator HflC [Balneolales bacterium]